MILIVSVTIWFLYFLSLGLAYPILLSNGSTDPLASVNSLFPLFYIVVPLFVFFCFLCAFRDVQNKYVHVALLAQLSVMLWITPFVMSGFSYVNDSLYHVGVSNHIFEALNNGTTSYLYTYGQEYPVSYVFNYILMEISGINSFFYAQFIYPIICAIVTVFLWYVFISRFMRPNFAFISTILAMLALGSVPQIHVCPHSEGSMLLMLSLLLLIAHESVRAQALGLFLSVVLILTHAISPLILVFFLLALYVVRLVGFDTHIGPRMLGRTILFVIAVWCLWSFFVTAQAGESMAVSLEKLATLDFSPEFQDIVTRTTSTTYYLFSEIKLLTKIASYSILCIALICLCKSIIDVDVGGRIRRLFPRLNSNVHTSHGTDLYFLAVALVCFLFSVPLLLSGLGGAGFGERSYTFFVFAIMACVGSNLQGVFIKLRRTWKKKIAVLLLATWFVFLALIYPLTAYQIDAYTAYPFSEGVGLNFVSSKTPLDTKPISIYLPQQLASYIDPQTHLDPMYYKVSTFGKNFSDIVVFRRSMYFSASLGYDLSLTNNSYTRALNKIELEPDFDKVYSNPTFEVYTRNQDDTMSP